MFFIANNLAAKINSQPSISHFSNTILVESSNGSRTPIGRHNKRVKKIQCPLFGVVHYINVKETLIGKRQGNVDARNQIYLNKEHADTMTIEHVP